MSPKLSAHEQRVIDFVESDGCFINAVFDPDGNEPDFAYSIGFPKTVNQPDVLISGLGLDLMKVLINDTLALCREGLVLNDLVRTDQILSGYECVVRKASALNLTAEYWGSAIWYQENYRGLRFETGYQIVWPDKAGRFSWDAGFDDLSGGGQLVLWEGGIIH